MRAVIIGNGEIKDYDYIKSKLKDDDYIICADGGLKHLDMLKIKADIALGDFDSAVINDKIKSVTYPVDKDLTDGEIALNFALEKDFSQILMIAMTGTRLDHTLTNIMMLSRDSRICLIDDKNEIYAVHNKLVLRCKKGKTLSIIPVFKNLTGVFTKGLKYVLNNDTLVFGTSRGNSNVIIDDKCTITVGDGIGIVIVNDGE